MVFLINTSLDNKNMFGVTIYFVNLEFLFSPCRAYDVSRAVFSLGWKMPVRELSSCLERGRAGLLGKKHQESAAGYRLGSPGLKQTW